MSMYVISWLDATGYCYHDDGAYGVYSSFKNAALAIYALSEEWNYPIVETDEDVTKWMYFTDSGTYIIERFTLDDADC